MYRIYRINDHINKTISLEPTTPPAPAKSQKASRKTKKLDVEAVLKTISTEPTTPPEPNNKRRKTHKSPMKVVKKLGFAPRN